jgi:AraC-like DNA-binding protein
MENDSPFLDPELTLSQLAARLGASTNHVSQVINTDFGQSFYDFVNRYRIEKAKALLSDQARADDKILSIALESGFNSKSAFNASFKKHTGMTPKDFRLRQQSAAFATGGN